jgi:hypothetical protein
VELQRRVEQIQEDLAVLSWAKNEENEQNEHKTKQKKWKI